MVNTRQRANVANEFIKKSRFQKICFFGDERLFGKNHFFGSSRISGEQTPINKPAVTQIRVVGVLGCLAQNLSKIPSYILSRGDALKWQDCYDIFTTKFTGIINLQQRHLDSAIQSIK